MLLFSATSEQMTSISIGFARRCVFTQPRPKADIQLSSYRFSHAVQHFAQARCAVEEYYETGVYLLAETIADAPNMRCST